MKNSPAKVITFLVQMSTYDISCCWQILFAQDTDSQIWPFSSQQDITAYYHLKDTTRHTASFSAWCKKMETHMHTTWIECTNNSFYIKFKKTSFFLSVAWMTWHACQCADTAQGHAKRPLASCHMYWCYVHLIYGGSKQNVQGILKQNVSLEHDLFWGTRPHGLNFTGELATNRATINQSVCD